MSGLYIAVLIIVLYLAFQSIVVRRANRLPSRFRLPRPFVYSICLAASGTSWLYYGSASYAAKNGIEFVGLFLGIGLMFTLGFPILGKVSQLAKSEGIKSISDFVGARYGKSFSVAALVTAITTIGLIPYIALQFAAIHQMMDIYSNHMSEGADHHHMIIALVQLGIAVYTVYIAARGPQQKDRYDGFIKAVAVGATIKLGVFLLIGIATVTFLFGSPTELFAKAMERRQDIPLLNNGISVANLVALMLVGASTVLLLPNQFYLTIVEHRGGGEMRLARWFTPLLLLIGGVFVIPITVAGAISLPPEAASDFYFICVPIVAGQKLLAGIAFLGGVPAATTMIIAPSILLSIMITNDLMLPLLLRPAAGNPAEPKDYTKVIPRIRRWSLVAILGIAWAYQYFVSWKMDFSELALISAVAVIQLVPPFVGALIWRRGTARGANWGMIAGFSVWLYTMVIPTLIDPASALLTDGPLGIAALKPQALFGVEAASYVHGLFFSLAANIVCYIAGSLSRSATPLERIQASVFITDKAPLSTPVGTLQPSITVRQLKETVSRYIGYEQAELAFASFHKREGILLDNEDGADFKTVHFAEQLLSGIVGSPSARMILSLAMGPTGPAQRRAQILLEHATDALAQNRYLLQTALDQMDQGICVFDPQYRLSCWNAQFRVLLNLPRDLQRMGTPFRSIVHYLYERGDLASAADPALLNDLAKSTAPWRITLTDTGQTIEIRSNSIPDGGIVTTLTDVTQAVNADHLLRQTNESLEQRVRNRTNELTLANQQLAKAQQRAEEANISKTRFLADAGHDILQPLNAARLYSSSLMERLGNSREKQLVSNVDSSLEAVEVIINALLDISRLDTGALKPVVSVFRLDSLLEQIVRDFSPTAHARGLTLDVVMSSLVVATDRNLLRRLVQNLVSNAIKYCRSGKVLVGARRRGDRIELQVFDTGIGIPKSQLENIFREFSRLAEGMKISDGLGLGLSIVERIAKILDLSVQVQSTPNKGSMFSVTIPVSKAGAPPAAENVRTIRPAAPLSGLSVLCIDDNPHSLAGMQELLATWGCYVVMLDSGEALKAYCQDNPAVPDVILADYNLGDENGIEMVAYTREYFQRHIPAALVTADRSNATRDQANAEDIAVIQKPVRPAALRALLSHFRQAIAAE
ncbi:response regulator [Phyllobacterium sp. SYP-B3895]|uniref:hybrid sensor histidine kinase/response regulator n=1 Tax=Phyllobacterium sp. SYP-B3895 TaxID=2663240 RepID=UPI0012999C36|nr:NahK/ErcS family hybrid sensor histidine kinase/response regulator [Phyllobacterium sp. SYP-B3895]MRG56391.1 response regulator [Phyllobacterium sp. SYP-B3895]